MCELSHALVLQALSVAISQFSFSHLETTFKISMAPFHKNPPSFNTLLVSNGQDKNKRKLNGLKHLFGDLVTFGRHIITRSLLGV
jgi:hypothetical protein